jgi:putative sulfotransferase
MGAFVVCTGRCGSTLVSRALATHPDVLSLFEFFTSLHPAGFPDGVITGHEFWRLLSDKESGAANILLRAGAEPPEMLYPVDDGHKFNRTTGLPRISAITLPAMTTTPDLLYDRLAATVPQFSDDLIAEHYLRLFSLLMEWQGRRQWVERSGVSGFFINELLAAFPHMRYVHLIRDLDATAASMSRHSFFRFIALRMEFLRRCRCDVFTGSKPALPVPPDLEPLLPETFNKDRFDKWSPGISSFRLLAAYQDTRIRTALRKLPSAQVHVLHYEDLVDDPVREFHHLADFLALSAPAEWAYNAAQLVEQRRANGT